MSKHILTQSRLKELFHYDPDTGVFTRLVRTANSTKIGEVAGSEDNGYIRMRVDHTSYKAHRLAWLYMFDSFPDHEIDHISGVRNDNRIKNLRSATDQENSKNQKRRYDNKTGTTGVYHTPSRDRWCAQIGLNGKHKHLGRFKTKSEAINARKRAEIKYGYHENHGRA